MDTPKANVTSAARTFTFCVLVSLLSCATDDAAPVQPEAVPGGPARIRRLSAREYVSVVSDLVGAVVRPNRFIEETFETGYDNGAANLTVQADQADTYELLASELAASAVREKKALLLGGCAVEQAGEEACKAAFFSHFAKRAFRRPLTGEELARLGSLFDEARRVGSFDLALETSMLAILQSPQFLYREELGIPGETGDRVKLTPHEVASELSFFLTGTMPDDALFLAADTGQLETADDIRREAMRLLETPRAKNQIRGFLQAWLATSRVWRTTKDGAAFPDFDPALHEAMQVELDRFYDFVLRDQGTLAQLFSSNVSFVNTRLARHYDLPPRSHDSFEQIELDPGLRGGILTRPGFLTVHSAYDSSNPIARGVFVRTAILCARPTPPPPGIPREVSKNEARTTRERYAAHTQDTFCQSCHASIDGVGFGFEEFDGTGHFRDMENGVRVDSSGMLLRTKSSDGAFRGVVELEARLVKSQELYDCFEKQMFRFAMGTGESKGDDATLSALSLSANTRITDYILDFVSSRAFRERWKD